MGLNQAVSTKTKKPTRILLPILFFILGAGLSGGLTYYFVNDMSQKDLVKSEANVKSAQDELAQVKTKLTKLEEKSSKTIKPVEKTDGKEAPKPIDYYEQAKAELMKVDPSIASVEGFYINKDGEFVLVWYRGGAANYKKINNKWTRVFDGQSLSPDDLAKLKQHKFPNAVVKTKCYQLVDKNS